MIKVKHLSRTAFNCPLLAFVNATPCQIFYVETLNAPLVTKVMTLYSVA